jgi:hypothetical protein
MGGLEIAHRLGTVRQDIGQHRLALGGPCFRGPARPSQSRFEIRTGLLLGDKQAVGLSFPRRPEIGQAVHAECGQQCLGFDMTATSCALEPARTFRPAGRHARSLQIASSDPVLGLRISRLGGARQQGKVFRGLAFVAQADCPTQGGRGRAEIEQPKSHEIRTLMSGQQVLAPPNRAERESRLKA